MWCGNPVSVVHSQATHQPSDNKCHIRYTRQGKGQGNARQRNATQRNATQGNSAGLYGRVACYCMALPCRYTATHAPAASGIAVSSVACIHIWSLTLTVLCGSKGKLNTDDL